MKIWRTFCILASIICLIFATGMGTVQAAPPISITMDGIAMQTDVPPFIDENGRTIVPLRFVSEALGCAVDWDEAAQRVSVSRTGTLVELLIGRKAAHVNGTEIALDTTAVLKEGRTMVPLRFLAETFGLSVEWKQASSTVALKAPPPAPPEPPEPPEPTAPPAPPAAGQPEETRIATVKGNNVNIRSGPGTDYERLAQVHTGTRLTVVAEDGGWFEVNLSGGTKGWIFGQYVSFATSGGSADTGLGGGHTMPAAATRSALVMKPSVNVRSAPGASYPVVDKVTLGQQLPITAEHNNWFSVKLPNGQSGWIAGWLVAVRYDHEKKAAAGDGNVTTALISRWSVGEQNLSGELPALTGMAAERSGNGVLLQVNADSALAVPASFRLENPSRIIFDFSARLGEQGSESTLQVGHGSVARFRLSQFDESTVRVVADLQGTASYALSQSGDGKTITIQIRPIDPTGKIIVVDPGHGSLTEWGGSDPGAIGPSGLRERDVVRSISLQLGNILLNEGYTVIYTNENDTGLSLEERALVGSIAGAELLVSVHANAHTNRNTAGTMTFYHAGAGSSLVNNSKALAGFIQAELLNRLQREDKGVLSANFIVLRTCSIPSTLVEVAFLSNPTEEKLLADPAFQRRAAEAIALGIKKYLAR